MFSKKLIRIVFLIFFFSRYRLETLVISKIYMDGNYFFLQETLRTD